MGIGGVRYCPIIAAILNTRRSRTARTRWRQHDALAVRDEEGSRRGEAPRHSRPRWLAPGRWPRGCTDKAGSVFYDEVGRQMFPRKGQATRIMFSIGPVSDGRHDVVQKMGRTAWHVVTLSRSTLHVGPAAVAAGPIGKPPENISLHITTNW